MATALVYLPQYAYSNVQFCTCTVYIKHTTHFTGKRSDCVLVAYIGCHDMLWCGARCALVDVVIHYLYG